MEQVESQIKDDLTENPLTLVKSSKYIGLGIVIGIVLLLIDLSIVYVYMIIYGIINRLNIGSTFISPLVMFFYISSLIGVLSFSYYYTGKYCGKRWRKPSWEWGFWLTLPIIGFAMIMYKQAIDIQAKTGNESAIIAGMIVTAVVVAYFVLLLVSSYGGYVGAKAIRQKGMKSPNLEE